MGLLKNKIDVCKVRGKMCEDISNPVGINKSNKIKDLLSDYAKNSTLHGLRYVTEKGLNIVEKMFWIVTFTASVILCSCLIKNVYVKWSSSPVIVTVSERLVSVGEVPFPSVTICPQTKCNASIYNFSKEFENVMANGSDSIDDLNKYLDISLLCNKYNEFEIGGRLFTNESFIENIDSVAPNISDFFMYLSWRNETHDMSEDFFKKVYTAEGVCYNMNGLAAEEIFRDTVQKNFNYSERMERSKGWTLESGYTWEENEPFPLQGSESIGFPDLEIYIISKMSARDGMCNGFKSGYNLYIQHPADHPQSSLYSYSIGEGQLYSMAITADITTTTASIKNIPPETRQCYLQEDRPLQYFKIYTASNCRAECISNYTMKICGCVGFYMPHSKSSRICAEKSVLCMDEAQNIMARRELEIKVKNFGEGCNCLPACDSVKYSAEVVTSEFYYKQYTEKLSEHYKTYYNASFDFQNTKYSKLDMYFKDPEFMSMRRSELFGVTDFLANIGGLLGVFLGFSFLSIVELVYFFTLRPLYAMKGETDKKGT